jgi:ribonuclease P protein component
VAHTITTRPLTHGAERRLRSRVEFDAVREQGRRVQTRHLTVLALPNTFGWDRLGIIASRRLGGAVLRNRAKRRVRELFRLRTDRAEAAPGGRSLDVVVIPRREVATAPFAEIAVELGSALRRLRATRPS